jgi:hypothetical protein
MSLDAMATPAARVPGALVTPDAQAHGAEGGLDRVGGIPGLSLAAATIQPLWGTCTRTRK